MRYVPEEFGLGCTNHSCVWGHPGGMGTNGPCYCIRNLRDGKSLDFARVEQGIRHLRIELEHAWGHIDPIHGGPCEICGAVPVGGADCDGALVQEYDEECPGALNVIYSLRKQVADDAIRVANAMDEANSLSMENRQLLAEIRRQEKVGLDAWHDACDQRDDLRDRLKAALDHLNHLYQNDPMPDEIARLAEDIP